MFASCGNLREQSVDTKAVAKELENRKIKHVTPAQINDAVNKWGASVNQAAQQNLVAVLEKALVGNDLKAAAAYCDVRKLDKASLLAQSYKGILKRSSRLDVSNAAEFSKEERQVMDAYQYNAENKLPQTPNVQRIGDKYLLYSSPILIDNTLCLRCHGTVGKDITQTEYDKLSTDYQLDSLVNFKKGDLIGVWGTTFEKKEIIKKL